MRSEHKFGKLFEPGQIGRLTLKNRIIMAPMGTSYATDTGGISPVQLSYYVERAKGGTAMIITEGCGYERRLGGWEPIMLDIDRYIPGHAQMVEAVHSYGVKIVLQLAHMGRYASADQTEGRQSVAPSVIPESEITRWFAPRAAPPRELSVEEIQELVEKCAITARRARMAGYDGVEIHGAHGYLVHQFMSPRTNKRIDQYGGSPENRIRFPVEIIQAIKRRAGRDFCVIFRLTAEETGETEGYTIEDCKSFCRGFENAGADAIDVSMGTMWDKDGVSRNACPMSFPQGWRVHYAEAIKQVVNIPVIAVGMIREPHFAENILKERKADFIALGRTLLADPEWPKKAAEERIEEIRKCITCNYCIHCQQSRLPIRCSINAMLGSEVYFPNGVYPAAVKKRTMVVGSGPGGMEFARVAALRGHKVDLYEKETALGAGQLKLAAVAPGKQKVEWLREYLTTQIQKMKIKIHLRVEVTPELVMEKNPEVIVIATGARPITPDIPGIDKDIVVTAHDVLAGRVVIDGQRVAVLGGWSLGCEVANFLVERGKMVTIVSRSPSRDLARGLYVSNRAELMAKLRRSEKVALLHEHAAKCILDHGVVVVNKNSAESTLEVDKVVLALGVIPLRELADQLKGKVSELYVIGDAAQPRDIASAVREGFILATRI